MKKIIPLFALIGTFALTSCDLINGLVPWKQVDITGTISSTNYSSGSNGETYELALNGVSGKITRDFKIEANKVYLYKVTLGANNTGSLLHYEQDMHLSPSGVPNGWVFKILSNDYTAQTPTANATFSAATGDSFKLTFVFDNYTGSFSVESI